MDPWPLVSSIQQPKKYNTTVDKTIKEPELFRIVEETNHTNSLRTNSIVIDSTFLFLQVNIAFEPNVKLQ